MGTFSTDPDMQRGLDGGFTVKDSGVRQAFETGSVRDSREGKGRFDLIPAGPLRRLAQHYEAGAAKYGDYNWQKGQNLQRYIDSALRHINNLQDGMVDEDHAIAAVWNLMSYVWTLDAIEKGLLPRSLDDRPAGSIDPGPLVTGGDVVREVRHDPTAIGLLAFVDGTEGGDILETDYFKPPLDSDAPPCGDHTVGDDPDCCGQYSLHTGAI